MHPLTAAELVRFEPHGRASAGELVEVAAALELLGGR
jgi:hypothetical protein